MTMMTVTMMIMIINEDDLDSKILASMALCYKMKKQARDLKELKVLPI